MQEKLLSVIIPISNAQTELQGMLRFIASQMNFTQSELILVDMGSVDNTILEAVQFIKHENCTGFVIQNGSSGVASALNTGLQKASGKYVTFCFPKSLYHGHLHAYLETAERMEADITFGCFTEEEVRTAERRSLSKAIISQTGVQYLKDILWGRLCVELPAVLFKRQFLKEKQLYFSADLQYGYEQEFLYNCFLYTSSAVQAPVLLQRNSVFEIKATYVPDEKVFQCVEAMLHVYDRLRTMPGKDRELEELFAQQKIPSAVMECVDVLLSTGKTISAIQTYLRVTDYKKLLISGRFTQKELKKKILQFKLMPWAYHGA